MRSLGVRSYTALPLYRIVHRHAAKPHIVGEHVKEASPRRHDPGSLSGVDGPFKDRTRAGKAERGPSAELLTVALALRHLQDARRAVDVGRGIAAGEERDVLQQLSVEEADRAAGRREVREGVDVGNLDVVHHEQILEGAAAADDDVVAKVVGADHHTGQALHVARHVLQGRGALENLARRHQKARVLHLRRRLKRRGRHGDRLLDVLHPGQRDLHGALQPGAHIHRSACKGQALERQNLKAIRARTQAVDAKGAGGVAGRARAGVEGTHTHARRRRASRTQHHAANRTHASGVLSRCGRGDEDHDRRESGRHD